MDLPFVIKNKRIAITLQGHMRTYKQTSPALLQLVDLLRRNNICEVFVHTWDEKEALTSTYYPTDGLRKVQAPISENDVKTAFKTDRILVETQTILRPDDVFYKNQTKEAVAYSEYSKWKVNELKKEYEKAIDQKFDIQICLRPDVILKDFSFPELLQVDHIWQGSNSANNAATDVVLFSSSTNIDQLREFYHVRWDYLGKAGFNVEGATDAYVSHKRLPIRRSKYTMPVHWDLLRSI